MHFDFSNDLFTFEMANNHQGDLAHAEKIIREVGKIAREYNISAAVKVQLRNLDTFIHKDYANDSSIKHIKRFSETRLDEGQFKIIAEMIKEERMLSMATVFDEESIAVFERINFDLLKIASCSAQDFPLLRALGKLSSPTIISTASLNIQQVANAVAALQTTPKSLAIMHCVGIYPTADSEMLLNRIDQLKLHFPDSPIGFSTHEDPNATLPIQLAVAKGARLFEKHVNVKSDYGINAYSATPDQVRSWLDAYFKAKQACSLDNVEAVREKEMAGLRTLKRAAFAKRDLEAGEKISTGQDCNVQFAIPASNGQILADNFLNEDLTQPLNKAIASDQAILQSDLQTDLQSNQQSAATSECSLVERYTERAKDIVASSGMLLPKSYDLELSHHYGMKRFAERGAALITLLNKGYCKKLIVMLGEQIHPTHLHRDRDESLCLVKGTANLVLADQMISMVRGEFYHIEKGVLHEIVALEDTVLEEITFFPEQANSHYQDEAINQLSREQRKTKVFTTL